MYQTKQKGMYLQYTDNRYLSSSLLANMLLFIIVSDKNKNLLALEILCPHVDFPQQVHLFTQLKTLLEKMYNYHCPHVPAHAASKLKVNNKYCSMIHFVVCISNSYV